MTIAKNLCLNHSYFLLSSDEVSKISGQEDQLSASSRSSSAVDSQLLDDIHFVELEKGDKGLGFSILDYQVILRLTFMFSTIATVNWSILILI